MIFEDRKCLWQGFQYRFSLNDIATCQHYSSLVGRLRYGEILHVVIEAQPAVNVSCKNLAPQPDLCLLAMH